MEDSKAIFTMKNVKTVVVSGAFSPALPLQKTEYPIEIFSVYITNLLTPRSTEPTSSFKVRIYDKLGFLQYKKESLAFSQVA